MIRSLSLLPSLSRSSRSLLPAAGLRLSRPLAGPSFPVRLFSTTGSTTEEEGKEGVQSFKAEVSVQGEEGRERYLI